MAAPTVWCSATEYTPNSIDFHPEVLWDPWVGLELTKLGEFGTCHKCKQVNGVLISLGP